MIGQADLLWLMCQNVWESIGAARDPVRLRRYLTTLVLNPAGQRTDASLLRHADIHAKTASAYDQALTNLAVLDVVAA